MASEVENIVILIFTYLAFLCEDLIMSYVEILECLTGRFWILDAHFGFGMSDVQFCSGGWGMRLVMGHEAVSESVLLIGSRSS